MHLAPTRIEVLSQQYRIKMNLIVSVAFSGKAKLFTSYSRFDSGLFLLNTKEIFQWLHSFDERYSYISAFKGNTNARNKGAFSYLLKNC